MWQRSQIVYQGGQFMSLYPWFNDIPHPLVEQPEKFARRKGGMSWPRVWSEELDSTSIRFLLSGLGRVSQRELYFDEPEFGGERNRAWRGKGLVFGVDGEIKGHSKETQGVRYRRLKVKSVKCRKDLKGMQSVVLHCFTMFSILPAKRDLKISTTGGGAPKRRYIGPQRWYKVYVCPFADLRSHTKLKLPLSDLENFECVLSNRLTEHISGTYADAWWFWFFTGCFVLVRSARVCLDVYLVSPGVSWGLFLIKFEQTWCDKCGKIKETTFHTETHGSTARQILKKEGRTGRTQSLINSRAGLEGLGRRPQSELYFDGVEFGVEPDCWWRGKGLVFGEDGEKKGHSKK